MVILNKENIKIILVELEKRLLGSIGIKICIQQGSRSFENWVQVELCGILCERLGYDINSIDVEEPNDIVIMENNEIKTAIEIKVICLGKNNQGDRKTHEKDIVKLKNGNQTQKIILRVIYDMPGANIKRNWVDIRGALENFLQMNIENQSHYPYEKSFKLGYNHGSFTNIYLYLNLW